MGRYAFLFKGRDPRGRAVATRVEDTDARSARAQLAARGWTELELVQDELGSLVSRSMQLRRRPSAALTVRYYEGTLAHQGKLWLDTLRFNKSTLGAMAFVAVVQATVGRFSILPWLVLGGALLVYPARRLFYGTTARLHRRLNRARVWARHEEALECVERLRRSARWTKIGLGEAELVRYRCMALAGLGRLDEAVEELRRLERDPRVERWQYLLYLAMVYDSGKDFVRGLACRKDAARARPQSAQVWTELAACLVRRFDCPAQAREALSHAEPLEKTALAAASLCYARGLIAWRERAMVEAGLLLDESFRLFEAKRHLSATLEGILLLIKAHRCAVHVALGQAAEAARLRAEVEPFLVVHREHELLAACGLRANTASG